MPDWQTPFSDLQGNPCSHTHFIYQEPTCKRWEVAQLLCDKCRQKHVYSPMGNGWRASHPPAHCLQQRRPAAKSPGSPEMRSPKLPRCPLGHRSGPRPSLNIIQMPLKEEGGGGSEEAGGNLLLRLRKFSVKWKQIALSKPFVTVWLLCCHSGNTNLSC